MGVLDAYKGMSEDYDDGHPAARTRPLSVKIGNGERAAISAVMNLTNGNKSEAVRLLIQAGWEAIEQDGAFDFIVQEKDDVHRLLDFGEDL